MLVFIGLGLGDERDLSLRGLDEARSCDLVFAEFYTSQMSNHDRIIPALEELVGKKVAVLEREDIEEKADEVLLAPAREKKVCLLVPGDPLVSTTHIYLSIDAKKRGIETRVIHNTSIISALSITGLQNYKFGRSASIPTPTDDFFPETPYDVLRENLKRGLHTILFLDIRVERGETTMMDAAEGMDILMKIEARRKEGVFGMDTLCVVIGRAGSREYVLKAGPAGRMMEEDLGPPPHTLIVPGDLHFMEEEYLKEFAGLEEGKP
jgi:diphthine synthase